MPRAAIAATSAVTSVEAMQINAPRPVGCHHRPAQLGHAADQALVQRVHVLARLGDPDLLHQLDPGDAGVDRRDRRRPGLETPGSRRRRVVVDVHREDVLVGEPAGRGRPCALPAVAAAIEEGKARGAEQVFEHPCCEEVHVQLLDVYRQRADRLVRVEEDERSLLVGRPNHLRDVGHRPGAIGHMRRRDEERVVVDRLRKLLRLRVSDPRPARLLCMPDLADRGEGTKGRSAGPRTTAARLRRARPASSC